MQPSKVTLLFTLAVMVSGCSLPSSVYPSKIIGNISHAFVKTLTPFEIKTITDSGIIDANNKFAFDIFSEILKKDSKKNIFISPASLSFALTMTYNGADKETKDAMAKVFHLDNLNLNSINNANKLLLDKLKNPASDIQIEIGNSLWGNKTFEFLPDFIDNNKKYYNAGLETLDFANEGLASQNENKINDWVSNNTHGKINKVVSKENFSQDTLMYLINAIYFKADWTKQFNENDTEMKDFHLANNTTKKVPMMKQFDSFKYLTPNSYMGNKFQAIELPYGSQGKVSMFILLPSYDSNLDELYKTIYSQDFKFDEMIKHFYLEGGYIALPRFKVKDEYNSEGNYMNDYLTSLGMGIAFDKDKANFFKLAKPKSADQNFYISHVGHVATAEINESGTVAVAVTVVEINVSPSSEPQQVLQMEVDHPFFFMIRDNETEQILFMGSVTDPQS